MADQLVTLGLTEIAREIFARRAAPPASVETSADLPYESDLLTPSMNLGREITPADLVSARTTARSGRPKSLCEIYDEMGRNGPGPQISKAKLALSSATVSFLPPEGLRGETDTSTDAQTAREIAEAARSQFAPRMTGLLSDWFEKVSHGWVGFHVISEARGLAGKWERIAAVEKITASRLGLNNETREWEYQPFPNDTTMVPCAPFVASGSLVVFETGKGSVPLDMRGLLFQCLVPWSLSSFAHRHLGRLSELFGIPLRLVWYDETKKGQKEIAQRAAQKMGAAAWGAFPSGMKVEIKDALSGQGAGEVQEKLIRIADRSYDRTFLGHSQASNVEVGAGSRTSTEEASEQSREIHRARAAEAATDLRDGLIRPWVRRNWGDDVAARLCPELEIEVKERKDGLKLAQTAATLVNAGVGSVDEEALVRACGLPYTADPAKAIQRPSSMALPTQASPSQLAAVVPFPSAHRLAESAAADGIGEEIVGPYRDIVARAAREGVSAEELLARLRHRTTDPVEAEQLVAALAASGLNAMMGGIVGARTARERRRK